MAPNSWPRCSIEPKRATDLSDLDIARMASTTIAVFRRQPWTFILLSAACVLTNYAVANELRTHLKPTVEFRDHTPYALSLAEFYGVSILIQMICSVPYYWLHAAIAHNVVADLRRSRFSAVASIRATMLDAPALGAIGVLTVAFVAIGFTLLVVPGIALNLAWFVVAPVRAIERPGIRDTLRRSQFLTRGYRWRILGPYLAILGLTVVPTYLFRQVYISLSATSSRAYWLGYVLPVELASVATTALAATFVAVLYYELRTLKDGAPPEDTASVFD